MQSSPQKPTPPSSSPAPRNLPSKPKGAFVHLVDYTSPTSLTTALQGVHTVTSTIAAFDASFATSQIALLEAAKVAGTFDVKVKAGTADLPGDGTVEVTFPRTQDIGRFVAASLDSPQWKEEMGMGGTTMTYREVVGVAEKVTGRELLVKCNGKAAMERMMEEIEESRLYSLIRISMSKGDWKVEPSLNERFPEIKP
ncbi:MAG: hypothetical protein Q9201_002094 [Fulgogasparrea decipioides]